MTLKSTARFTPETLLSTPRRDTGAPNHDASKILYSVTSYSFQKHEQSSELRLLDAKTNESKLVTDDKEASNPTWLGRDESDNGLAVVLRGTEKGKTQVLIGEPQRWSDSHYLAGTIPSKVSDLKITKLGEGYYGFAVSTTANPDGSLYNAVEQPKRHTTARLYNSLYVRHWDKYLDKTTQSIVYGAFLRRDTERGTSYLQKHGEPAKKTEEDADACAEDSPQASSSDKSAKKTVNEVAGPYFMTHTHNPLKGTGLESPIPHGGGMDHFDISKTGLTFVAKEPSLNPALHTKCNIYYAPISDFLEFSPEIQTVNMGQIAGAMSSPVFSNNGSQIAFLAQQEDGYESDKNQLFVMRDVSRPSLITHLLSSADGKGSWNRSPDSIQWSSDDKALYLTADNKGQKDLFFLPADATDVKEPTLATFQTESIAGFKPLRDGRLYLAMTSLVESSNYTILERNADGGHSQDQRSISSMTCAGESLGLSFSQVGSIWVPGAGANPETKDKIHCWVVRPSDFNPRKRYPVAFLVHGGPQGAWDNGWSTRWNPAVFAEQGYVVVAPNPTGSTGYGQSFTDAIQDQWGGLPYQDLVHVYNYLASEVKYVDMDRAVALGASYGGYMMNWMQGHDLGRKFKALVCHDGVFSTQYALSTDELYFNHHDFDGEWSTHKDKWLKWDPMQYTQNWKTPELIIHNDLDYRLAVTDGLAAFNILQTQGVESQLLNFPDENHFVLNPENSLKWHQTVINWMNKHVGMPPMTEDVVEQEITCDRAKSMETDARRIRTVVREDR
ncbi:MAG: hypothetical protein M1828_002186 [Chrysothrix sp. TS-e1954]|nr:MAG: hypothetical protein M1828_002186 [Chrysothrix sp. TS-e1954]